MKIKLLVAFALIAGLCLLGCEGPAGAPGIAGEDGTPGADGVKGPKGPDGDQGEKGDPGEKGPDGEKGERGDNGERGASGPSVQLWGELDDKTDLDAEKTAAAKAAYEAEDETHAIYAWLIGGELWIWGNKDDDALESIVADGEDFGWLKKGPIQGPKGPKGPEGEQGAEGPSTDGISFATITFDAAAEGKITVGSETLMVGGKIKEPVPPVKRLVDFPLDGLYKDVETITYQLEGWYEGGEKWDFDKAVEGPMHLTARYIAPTPFDLRFIADGVTANTGTGMVQRAIYYIVTANNAAGGATNGAYTLYLGHDVAEYETSVPIAIGSAVIHDVAALSQRMDLTIKGIHGQRQIRKNGNGSLFNMGHTTNNVANINANIKLTLDNVVLVGQTTGANPLVRVSHGAQFIMKDGSGVTGNWYVRSMGYGYYNAENSAGVLVSYGGQFTMDGGVISGNRMELTAAQVSGGTDPKGFNRNATAVCVLANLDNASYPTSFIMNGGKISGNGGFAYSGSSWTASPRNAAVIFVDNEYPTRTIFEINGGEISGNNNTATTVNFRIIDQRIIQTSTGSGTSEVLYSTLTPALKMTGGKITGNTVSGFVVAAIKEMTGGEITGNVATATVTGEMNTYRVTNGYAAVQNLLKMSGGIIKDNGAYDACLYSRVAGTNGRLDLSNGNAELGNVILIKQIGGSAEAGIAGTVAIDVNNWTGTIDKLYLATNRGNSNSNTAANMNNAWGSSTTPQPLLVNATPAMIVGNRVNLVGVKVYWQAMYTDAGEREIIASGADIGKVRVK